jgi:hypothetical protein
VEESSIDICDDVLGVTESKTQIKTGYVVANPVAACVVPLVVVSVARRVRLPGAALVQFVPLDVRTLPFVPGATATTAVPPTVAVPVTVRLLPTVTFPLASLTMLLVDPDGWIALMTLIVLMAASY